LIVTTPNGPLYSQLAVFNYKGPRVRQCSTDTDKTRPDWQTFRQQEASAGYGRVWGKKGGATAVWMGRDFADTLRAIGGSPTG